MVMHAAPWGSHGSYRYPAPPPLARYSEEGYARKAVEAMRLWPFLQLKSDWLAVRSLRACSRFLYSISSTTSIVYSSKPSTEDILCSPSMIATIS